MGLAFRDPTQLEAMPERVHASLDYLKKFEEICTSMLGITKDALDPNKAQRSVQLDTSEKFYDTSIRYIDPVLGFVSIRFGKLGKQH